VNDTLALYLLEMIEPGSPTQRDDACDDPTTAIRSGSTKARFERYCGAASASLAGRSLP
jgi:hypothetical protein